MIPTGHVLVAELATSVSDCRDTLPANMHTRSCTRARARAHERACIHASVYSLARVFTRTYMHSRVHRCSCVCTGAGIGQLRPRLQDTLPPISHSHSCTRARAHTRAQACIHASVHSLAREFTRTYVHSHTHTCARVRTHTPTRAHLGKLYRG